MESHYTLHWAWAVKREHIKWPCAKEIDKAADRGDGGVRSVSLQACLLPIKAYLGAHDHMTPEPQPSDLTVRPPCSKIIDCPCWGGPGKRPSTAFRMQNW